MTLREAAERARLDTSAVERALIAVGIPIPSPDAPFIDESIFGIFVGAQAAVNLYGEAASLQFSRVMGAAAARIAEAAVGMFVSEVRRTSVDGAETEAIGEASAAQIPMVFSAIFPKHMALAIERDRAARQPGRFDSVTVALGFVDLVESTEWAEQLSPIEHVDALLGFESAAWSAAATNGGRVVKLIGDEAMFVATDVTALCHTAFDLCDSISGDPRLPPARGAVGFGEVIARDGDYFGSLVNLVSRCVKTAPVGQVVVVGDARQELDSTHWKLSPLTSPPMRGISLPVPLWTITAGS